MPYTIQNALAGFQPIAVTDDVQNHPLGMQVTANDPIYGGGTFIYLKGVASTQIGTMVDYDQYLGTTTISPATAGRGPVAISMSANTANRWGWYQVVGSAVVRAPNAMTAGADVFSLAATPGSVDDAQVNGEQIVNATVSTTTGTPSTGLGVIEIAWPFHQGQIV